MNRRYDFDWLRVGGSLLVLLAHATMLFSPWTPDWAEAVAPVAKSKVFSQFGWNLNVWLMPLFMLLAGSSAGCMLRRRSNREYLRDRLVHLGLPLLVLELTYVLPAAYWVATSSGQFSGSIGAFYSSFFRGNLNLMHLWFLFYLLIYSAALLPLFRLLQRPASRQKLARLARWCARPGGLYIFALPLLAVRLALYGVSPATLDTALRNDWQRFVSLGLVFVLGYVLIAEPGFQAAIRRQWRLTTGLALGSAAILGAIAWPDSFNPYRDLPLDYSWRYMAFWTLFELSAWSWLLAWLGLGQRFLNVDHPWRQWLVTASFPVYLLHPIVLFPSAWLMVQVPLGAFGGAALLTAMTLAGTLGLTVLALRLPVWRRRPTAAEAPVRERHGSSGATGHRRPGNRLAAAAHQEIGAQSL